MITDEELQQKIEQVMEGYEGQLDELFEAVGMVVMGRRYGSDVMRLISSRRQWARMIELFGEPHELMRRRDRLTYKSVGLKYIEEFLDYWEVIKGHLSISKDIRKKAKSDML